MNKIGNKTFVIGLCVIIALVILFYGIDYLKGINLFRPANFYYAEYENVAGLEVAAPVTINGYKVGQVREISFNYEHPGTTKVLLALDSKLRLPEDSYAAIGTGLLNGAYVDIRLGKSSTVLPVGSTMKSGTDTDLMATVNDQIMPQITSILPRVDSLLASLNRVVADPAIGQSVKRLDEITANLSAATGSLRVLMAHQMPGILSDAGRVTTNLDSITANLTVLSAQLKELPLQSTMSNVETTTSQLATFSTQLNSPNSTLGMLTHDPELYLRLNRAVASVDSLIVDIKRNPKRYISIKLL